MQYLTYQFLIACFTNHYSYIWINGDICIKVFCIIKQWPVHNIYIGQAIQDKGNVLWRSNNACTYIKDFNSDKNGNK